jgi:hypothetical protein
MQCLILKRLATPAAVWVLLTSIPCRSDAAQDIAESGSRTSSPAPQSDVGSQRLYLGAGEAAPSAVILGERSQHGLRFDSHAGYGYRVLNGLEIGADIGIFSGGPVILPMAYLRPYAPLAQGRVEIGFDVRLGLFLLPNLYSKVGGSFALGLDARVWLTDNVGLQLSAEGMLCKGPDREGGPDVEEDGPQVSFIALGTTVAAVFRF